MIMRRLRIIGYIRKEISLKSEHICKMDDFALYGVIKKTGILLNSHSHASWSKIESRKLCKELTPT